jgi:hypothetical protein
VRVFDPTAGTTAIQVRGNVASVKLTLWDHPVILEMDPTPGGRRAAVQRRS